MNCNNIIELIDNQRITNLDNLTDDVRLHIEECKDCQVAIQIELGLQSFLLEKKSIQLPIDFTEEVITHTRNIKGVSPHKINLNNWKIAASVILIAGSISFGIIAGKYSANSIYLTNNQNVEELASALDFGMSDNSFDLINFDE